MREYSRHVVKAVIEDERGTLLIYLPQKDVYELPGGSVEEGEGLEEALEREISEETGYNLKKIITKLSEKEEELGSETNLIHFYHCTVNHRQENTNLTDEEIKAEMRPVWYDLASVIAKNKSYIKTNDGKTDCSREKRSLAVLIRYSTSYIHHT